MKKIVAIIAAVVIIGGGGFFFWNQSKAKTAEPITLNYSAAASLKDALAEIETNYEKEHPNVDLAIDYGGSGAIREKVVSGAPIDGVLLASKADTDKLVAADAVTDEKKLLTNTLVLVKNAKSDIQKADLADVLAAAKKIAIGNPETVPAGQYAQDSLKNAQLYDQVKDKLVLASDVRQVLAYVEAGNADVGFVYQTDALTTDKVEILQAVPDDLHEPILYYTATVKASKQPAAVAAFNDYLTAADSQKVLEDYGFSMAE